MFRFTTAIICASMFLSIPSSRAAAQEAPEETGPASADGAHHPFFVGAGLGVALPISGGGNPIFKLQEDLGYRFLDFDLGGSLDGGVFAGLSLGQAFGDRVVFLQFDVRGGADFELFDGGDVQLLATPSIALGAGVGIVEVPGMGSATAASFNLQFAAQAELVIADGVIGIWLRPIGVDLFIAEQTSARWDLLAGLNVRL